MRDFQGLFKGNSGKKMFNIWVYTLLVDVNHAE